MEEFFEGPSAAGEQNDNVDLVRYLKGILRRWWLVLLCTAAVSVPSYINQKSQLPIYRADAWLSFENLSGNIPDNLIETRMARLRSRSFAEEVTAELGLTLELIQDEKIPIYRQDVFKTFFTNRNPIPGRYEIRLYSDGHAALRSETATLDSVWVERFVDDTVTVNGFSFSLNPDILKKRSVLPFRINGFQQTVGSLVARETIIPNGRTLMQLTLTDMDPYLASETVNMLAEKFVRKSMDLAKRATRFNRVYLENQLQLVQQELNQSDAALKNFRGSHIQDLDQETRETVNRLSRAGEQMDALTLQKKDLLQLLAGLDPDSANFDGMSVRYIYQQITEVPVFRGDQEMAIASQEMRNAYESLDRMRGFPAANQEVRRINEDLIEIQVKIVSQAREKLTGIDAEIERLKAQEAELQKTLGKLPQEELNFIRLNRQRRANEVIYEALLKNYKEAQIVEAVDSENISIIDPAVPDHKPISGGKWKKILYGFGFGFFLGIGAAFLWEVSDKSIRTRDDIKRFIKLPVLGVIPHVTFDSAELQDSEKAKSISSQIVTHDYSPTPVGEAYRSLRTSLLFSKTFGPVRSLVVSSVAPSEGKSFTAANLAITLAQQKSNTLLIDADFRRGVLHNSFNCPKKPGLTNYLTGAVSFDGALNETYIPNLTLITCGSMVPNPSELLGSDKMQKFIQGVVNRFDFVIFDTPPLLAASDAIILGTLVDAVTLVVLAGKTRRDDVQRKMELFQNVRAKVIGAILNGAGAEVAHEGYSYYSY
jgi:tyrosine-protein kinase Etk/Wzc